jgi:hypothetical protein
MIELLVGALSICATPQTKSHVTYAKGLLFLLIAAIPLVNFIAILVCLWSILGDKVNGVLSKPMIRETK